jgi:starch phosphorylase
VQGYAGRVDPDGSLVEAVQVPLVLAGREADGTYRYEIGGSVPYRRSGLHGFTVRVVPCHPDLLTPFLPGLIAWAGPETAAG